MTAARERRLSVLFVLSLAAWFLAFFFLFFSRGCYSTGCSRLDYLVTAIVLATTGIAFSASLIRARPMLHHSLIFAGVALAFLALLSHFPSARLFFAPPLMLAAAGWLGWSIALRIDEKRFLFPLAVAAGLIDIWSVVNGPTGTMVKTKSHLLDLLLLPYPALANGRILGYVGVSDFIVASIFFGSAILFKFDQERNLAAIAFSFVCTFALVALTGLALPVLPAMAIFFIVVNWSELEIGWRDLFVTAFVLASVVVVYEIALAVMKAR
jgi:hypothetical protein